MLQRAVEAEAQPGCMSHGCLRSTVRTQVGRGLQHRCWLRCCACVSQDTVNTASRMMTTGQPGLVHASAAFRDLVPHAPWQSTGGVHVKGKGKMHTFCLAG